MLDSSMPKRSSTEKPKRPRDVNKLAFQIVQESIGASVPEKPAVAKKRKAKDPAAVALGRKGELKGGKARAASMTKEQLVAQAKKAAEARWGKEQRQDEE